MQKQLTELALLIRHVRKAANLSQIELAEYAGVSRSVVQDIESGEVTSSWGNILKILEVLNIKLHFESPLDKQRKRS